MKDYISTFRIPIDKIPQAKKWKVGGKYRLIADVEQVGINKERDYSDMEDGPVVSREKKEPKFKTTVEFKVYNVSAKDKALKDRTD